MAPAPATRPAPTTAPLMRLSVFSLPVESPGMMPRILWSVLCEFFEFEEEDPLLELEDDPLLEFEDDPLFEFEDDPLFEFEDDPPKFTLWQ